MIPQFGKLVNTLFSGMGKKIQTISEFSDLKKHDQRFGSLQSERLRLSSFVFSDDQCSGATGETYLLGLIHRRHGPATEIVVLSVNDWPVFMPGSLRA